MKSRVKGFFRSLTGRLFMSALLWSGAALAVGGITLSFVFRSYVLTDVDDRLSSLMDALVGFSEISPEGVLRFNRPLLDQRFASPYSGWYWQVSEVGKESFRSRSLWDYELTPDMGKRIFSIRFSEVEGPDGQMLRMAERDIILPEDDRIFRYLVATDTGEVRNAIARFNWLLVSALALIMLTVSMALVIQVAYGLRPLRVLGRKLGFVRAGRDSRIEGDWPEDLRPLAQEINALIDQNEKLVERARTHVGNLAHALKTPLSVIMNEIESDDSPRARVIRQQAREIKDHIDHHLKRARIAGGGSGPGLPIRERLGKLTRAITRMHKDKGLTVEFTCPDRLMFDGEKEDFDEILGNVVDNAAKWANSRVAIEATMVQDANGRRPMMDIRVEDDGPGVPEDKRDTLFERGKRLDERVPGTGLGLAIVRDIVDMYGGTAYVEAASLGGLAVILRLPAKVSGESS